MSYFSAFGQGVYWPPDYYDQEPSSTKLFIANEGQVRDVAGNARPDVLYYTDNLVPNLFLASNRVSFCWQQATRDSASPDSIFRIDMSFLAPEQGGGGSALPVGHQPAQHHLNFYGGSNATGITNVPAYSRVLQQELYAGIDLHTYSGAVGPSQLWVIHPGANPNMLRFQFAGQDQLSIEPNELKLTLRSRTLQLPQAIAYQVDASNQVVPLPWLPTFVNQGNGIVGLQLGSYNPAQKLLLQMGAPPVPVPTPASNLPAWASSFGGAGHDAIYDLVTDASGNLYVAGETASSATQFPASTGVFQNSLGGSVDGFAARFDEGYQLRWATYIGGSGADVATAICTDADGKVYVAGSSESTDLSLVATTPSMYAAPIGSGSSFLIRLSGILGTADWLTAFARGDFSTTTALDVDAENNVYLGGYASFAIEELTCDPPTGNATFSMCDPGNGAYVLGPNGQSASTPFDGYLACFNPDAELQWSTMLGGSGNDFIQDLAVNPSAGKLAVTGKSTSPSSDNANSCGVPLNGDFPLCATNQEWLQPHLNSDVLTTNNFDAFVIEFNLDGALQWSSYFGGEGNEVASAIGYTVQDELYIAGLTETAGASSSCLPNSSQGFPFCANGNAWSQAFNTPFTNNEAFIARFDKQRVLQWSTYLGSSGAESEQAVAGITDFHPGPALAIDHMDRPIVGLASNGPHASNGADFPFKPIATDYYRQSTNADVVSGANNLSDAAVAGFDAGDELRYATYFGGAGSSTAGISDVGTAIATYNDGTDFPRVYLAGFTHSSSDFPYFCPSTASNPWCESGMGGTITSNVADAFIGNLVRNDPPPSAIGARLRQAPGRLDVFPNPSAGQIYVRVHGLQHAAIRIVDLLGKPVHHEPIRLSENYWSCSVQHLPPGMYMVVASTAGERQRVSRKLLRL